MMGKYSAISLFTGVYGLDIGLEKAGFEVLHAIEIDRDCCETLRLNVPNIDLYEGDIRDVDPGSLRCSLGLKRGKLDLLAGGPPCQAYSTAGRRGALNDPRGDIIRSYFDFVREFKPRLVLIENVRGILSAALEHVPLKERLLKKSYSEREMPGSVIRFIQSQFEDIRYHCLKVLVDAVNYGTPQTRQRVFFVAIREPHNAWQPPEPTHRYEFPRGKKPARVYEGSRFFRFDDLPAARTLGDAIAGLNGTEHEYLEYSPKRKEIFSMLREGQNWRDLPPEIQKLVMGNAMHASGGKVGFWRRLSFEKPSPTILTSMVQKASGMCHPRKLRPLSIQECAVIQQFPKTWHFCGTTQSKYRQIGNAVPIGLARAFGESLALAINNRS